MGQGADAAMNTTDSLATVGSEKQSTRELLALTLGALGVVYGDIGTSPLYALRECFNGPHAVAPTPQNVLGILSLIFWALMLVVSVKYLVFILRADNRGEGGILSLMALALKGKAEGGGRIRYVIVSLGLFGAALLYGDGMITPAISVLGAMEGLAVARPVLKPYVVPLCILVILALFLFQRRGTAGIGKVFGPVCLLWFVCLAVLGVASVLKAPEVLLAVNPLHGARFLLENKLHGFFALGAVFLVVTGGEALYADMGHFGRRPIRLAWFALVLPALLVNYFGQGALLLTNPAAVSNPFYGLAPSWFLLPLVVIATCAATVASQAVISGAFSLTRQALQLGYAPRMEITHTSDKHIGQIYIPAVNWFLMLSVVALVWNFGSSGELASAYGIAVTTTMVITTCLAYFVAVNLWNWNRYLALVVVAALLVMDLSFFSANVVKLGQGGWFPLAVAAGAFLLMSTWKKGREILARKLRNAAMPIDDFLKGIEAGPPLRVPGVAVFMTGNDSVAPPALLHNLKHNKVLHERVVLLTVTTVDVPRVRKSERLSVRHLDLGFAAVTARYGYMEDPNVLEIIGRCKDHGLPMRLAETTFFLGRETLIPTKEPGMPLWREALFAWMSQNARSATAFFRLPPNRVVELGAQIEL